MRFCIAAIVLAATAVAAWACPSPGNIEGVAFTNSEKLDLAVLTAMGEEGVNYVIDGEEPNIAVRYISHVDPKALVYVGNYGLSYQQGTRLNSMGVILPLDEGGDPFASVEESRFDFAAVVRAELEWLVDNGVIELDAATIATIDSALGAAVNGGVQFWTHAGTVLGYNSWYNYDEKAGEWEGGDGVYADAQALRGVDGVKGCSVVQPGQDEPTKPLGATTAGVREVAAVRCAPGMSLSDRAGLILRLNRPLRSKGEVALYDPRGAVFVSAPIEPGQLRVTLPSRPCVSAGNYLAVLESGATFHRMMVSVVR
jgi:hypothetical protein